MLDERVEVAMAGGLVNAPDRERVPCAETRKNIYALSGNFCDLRSGHIQAIKAADLPLKNSMRL